MGSLISQEKLTDKSPKLVDLTDKAPLHNADSFKYFIYDVAHQAMPVAKFSCGLLGVAQQWMVGSVQGESAVDVFDSRFWMSSLESR